MNNTLNFSTSTSQLIRQRYSCRTYQKRPLAKEDLNSLIAFIPTCRVGPLGNQSSFWVLPASDHDSRDLPRLGTYGFIKDPAAFIAGSITGEPGALVDFGYSMELLVLKATELDLGSCWLGGTFTKSSFARQVDLQPGESIPAVVSLGYPSDQKAWLDRTTRSYAGSDHRSPWEMLFFTNTWQQPISKSAAGVFSGPLDLVRLAPSASNKQPWRLLHDRGSWHFYLERTANYPSPVFGNLLHLADLQLLDMGIAVAHFDLGLKESGLPGFWIQADPRLDHPGRQLEYIISWKPAVE